MDLKNRKSKKYDSELTQWNNGMENGGVAFDTTHYIKELFLGILWNIYKKQYFTQWSLSKQGKYERKSGQLSLSEACCKI